MDPTRRRALTMGLAGLAFAAAATLAALIAMQPAGLLRLATTTSSLQLMLLALTLGCSCATPRDPAELLGTRKSELSHGATAALLIATLGASYALDTLLGLTPWREESALSGLAELLHGARGVDLWLALLTFGLLPAFAEELLCRGLVQRELARRHGIAVGIGVSTLLFAALHGEAIHALLAAPLGLHLGLVAWWAGSTRPAVLCHAVNNTAAVVLLATSTPPLRPSWLHVAIGLLLTALGWRLALLGRARPRAESSLQPSPGTDDA